MLFYLRRCLLFVSFVLLELFDCILLTALMVASFCLFTYVDFDFSVLMLDDCVSIVWGCVCGCGFAALLLVSFVR